MDIFKGRKLVIATKHEKEKVIAPIIERELGLKCIVIPAFDTDKLGTFSGEIERTEDPLTTARNKCIMAMEQSNCDMAIASEGSFGPHPSMYFMSCDEEILLFMDKKNQIEIATKQLSVKTNFNASEVKTEAELRNFADNAKFPSHGLILRKDAESLLGLVKGITDRETLNRSFHQLISDYGSAYVETDMRAMHNPSRMKVIEDATIELAKKIKSLCPKCHAPGFGITRIIDGLPCELCDFPTQSILSYIYTCEKCHYTQEEKFPKNKFKENPMYCDICNP